MADGLIIEVQGLDQARANLRALYEGAPAEFTQAFGEWGGDVMMESQAECPYDPNNPHDDGTPHLRDTAEVGGPTDTGGAIVLTLGYDQSYAAVQHETPWYRHDWPTKWKFLEDPINRNIPRLAPNIIKRTELILQRSNERMSFTSPYAARRDYQRSQDVFQSSLAERNVASVGHLMGRFTEVSPTWGQTFTSQKSAQRRAYNSAKKYAGRFM